VSRSYPHHNSVIPRAGAICRHSPTKNPVIPSEAEGPLCSIAPPELSSGVTPYGSDTPFDFAQGKPCPRPLTLLSLHCTHHNCVIPSEAEGPCVPSQHQSAHRESRRVVRTPPSTSLRQALSDTFESAFLMCARPHRPHDSILDRAAPHSHDRAPTWFERARLRAAPPSPHKFVIPRAGAIFRH
jgi:hypothetical protein